jgi:hypothetical protein
MQNVLRAVGCPHGEKPVIRVLQRAATANRDESGVALFGKDHNRSPCERVRGKLSGALMYSSIAFIYFNLSGQRPTLIRLVTSPYSRVDRRFLSSCGRFLSCSLLLCCNHVAFVVLLAEHEPCYQPLADVDDRMQCDCRQDRSGDQHDQCKQTADDASA